MPSNPSSILPTRSLWEPNESPRSSELHHLVLVPPNGPNRIPQPHPPPFRQSSQHPLPIRVVDSSGQILNPPSLPPLPNRRPIQPLPLRKPKTASFGILKNPAVPSLQHFVTEFGGLQDDSFISNTSSVSAADSSLTEIAPPPQSHPPLRPKSSRADFSTDLRGTKRRGTVTNSPSRANRVFSAGSIGNKENGLPDVGRRASDSPVKSGGLGNGVLEG